MEEWSKWCRLCGRTEVVKGDSRILTANIVEDIKNCFSIKLFTNDVLPIVACDDCMSFSIKLGNFSKQCVKVDKMFTYLVTICKIGLLNKNLADIRYEFGIDIDHQIQIQELHNGISETVSLMSNSVNFGDVPIKQVQDIEQFDRKPIGRRKNRLFSKGLKKRNIIAKLNRDIKIETLDSIEESPTRPTTYVHTSDKPKETSLIFNCPVCLEKFKRAQLRNEHVKQNHGDVIKPFKCDECSKSFADSRKLKAHTIMHLPVNERPSHKCPYCEKCFCRQATTYIHIRTVHATERNFVCEECGKSFHTSYRLKDHYYTHTEARTFKCLHCPKGFKNRQQLKIHEDSHEGTSYQCKICNIKLNTKRILNEHLLVHTDEKKFKCHLCKNEYKRRNALRRHLGTHMGIKN